MTEGKSEYLDSELLKEPEGARERLESANNADELKTTRLPPITPPPPPAGPRPLPPAVSPPVSSAASSTVSSTASPSFPPAVSPSVPPALPRGRASSAASSAPAAKPSWLHALLESTFPPQSATPRSRADAPIRPQTAGIVFAVLGVVFAVVALVTGLRGAPSEALAPSVAASLVIARALVALGSGALSFAMFRQAERLLVQEPPTSKG